MNKPKFEHGDTVYFVRITGSVAYFQIREIRVREDGGYSYSPSNDDDFIEEERLSLTRPDIAEVTKNFIKEVKEKLSKESSRVAVPREIFNYLAGIEDES